MRLVSLFLILFAFVILSVGLLRPSFSPVLAAADAHVYVLIEVTTPMTAEQKVLARDALLELGRQYDIFPSNKTHLRTSLDNQKAIVEVVVPTSVTKAQVVTKLAEHLPWSEATIDANLNLTAFGGLGATWEESRQAAISYLIANSVDWETSE